MTEVAPKAAESQVDAPRGPWYRNPWVWGVIAGLILVPAIRPFMRHIPDAPPVLGVVPEYQLPLSEGGVATSSQLAGRVYVLGMYGPACEPECAEVFSALKGLSERFVKFERGITVVAVQLVSDFTPGQGVDLSSEWLKFDSQPESLDLLASEALAPHVADLSSGAMTSAGLARHRRLFIVDAAGKLRGNYGIDELSLDEIYHRAQHVLRDHRINGEL